MKLKLRDQLLKTLQVVCPPRRRDELEWHSLRGDIEALVAVTADKHIDARLPLFISEGKREISRQIAEHLAKQIKVEVINAVQQAKESQRQRPKVRPLPRARKAKRRR